jgi:hypothetical protein
MYFILIKESFIMFLLARAIIIMTTMKQELVNHDKCSEKFIRQTCFCIEKPAYLSSSDELIGNSKCTCSYFLLFGEKGIIHCSLLSQINAIQKVTLLNLSISDLFVF